MKKGRLAGRLTATLVQGRTFPSITAVRREIVFSYAPNGIISPVKLTLKQSCLIS